MKKNNINEIRKSRRLTYEALAAKMNTSTDMIYKHISMQRKLTQDWLERYAKALDCSIVELLDSTLSRKNNLISALIDSKKLYLTKKAVAEILKAKKKKYSLEEVANYEAAVYNMMIDYELQGEVTSPKVVADLLFDRGRETREA